MIRGTRCWAVLVAIAQAIACGGDDGGTVGRDGGARTDGGGDRDGGGDAGRSGDGGGGDPDGGSTSGDPTPAEFRYCEAPGSGTVIEAGPADYRDHVPTLRPGDTLRLAAGSYPSGLTLQDLQGEEGNCIVIEGPASGPRAVFLGSSSRNTISIRDSSFVVIRNLEVDGQGMLGDGLKAEGDAMFAHHIVVDGLYIHDLGGDMQIVGINTKTPAWRWVIRNNLIVNVGTGLYLGGSGGDTPFIGGLIEHNVVLDPLGYGMQIKHQLDRPALPGIPATATTIIRHNVWSKQNRALGGADARPNLLVGHFPTTGPGMDDQYLIYGNFFHENPVGESLFQGEGHVALYSNVFFTTGGPAVVIQPHNDVPKRIDVLFNTIVASGRGVRIAGADPAFAQTVIGNAVFADGAPLEGGAQMENVTGSVADAAMHLVAPGGPPGTLDLHPRPGRLGGFATPALGPEFLAQGRDFDHRGRGGYTDRGAYAGPADASSWMLARERKP